MAALSGAVPAGVFSPLARLVSFPLAYNAPGLNTGLACYQPASEQILYDAWVEILVGFNGSTPKADIGQGLNNAKAGLFGGVPLTTAQVSTGTGPPVGGGGAPPLASTSKNSRNNALRFATGDPLLVWASTNGQLGGPPIGGTAGQATLVLLVLA